MKRILNKCIYLKDKLLCFMWECQFKEEIIWSDLVVSKLGICRSPLGFETICKHCGAHKHD